MIDKNPNTLALLERARKLCDPPTWYQLGKRTGIKEQTISRCRLHGKTLGDINAYKLAKLLQMDTKDVMAYMAEDRAQDEITKSFWTDQLPRLLPSIAIAATALLSGGAGGSLIDGQRDGTNAVPFNISTLRPIHYAQLTYRLKPTPNR